MSRLPPRLALVALAIGCPAAAGAHPESPVVLPGLDLAAPSTAEILLRYGRIGIEHLVGGLDHVLFVLALVLLATHARRLFATVTAFTIGHSLTLVASALGVLTLPAAWAEIGIALTLVVVALQVLEETGAAHHGPALAGVFGLVHGLGFSGALADVGLPIGARLPALLGFNVGLELGQLAVVLISWPLLRALEQQAPRAGTLARIAVAHAIGALAFMWMLERL